MTWKSYGGDGRENYWRSVSGLTGPGLRIVVLKPGLRPPLAPPYRNLNVAIGLTLPSLKLTYIARHLFL